MQFNIFNIKKSHTIFFLIFIVFGSLNLSGQNESKIPTAKDLFIPPMEVKFEDFFNTYHITIGLSEESKMVYSWEGKSKFSQNHRRYIQNYQGYEVFGKTYILHGENGVVTHATGSIAKNLNIDFKSILSDDKIEQIALSHFNQDSEFETYIYDNDENKINVHFDKKVIIDQSFPDNSNHYSLAYNVTLESTVELKKIQYFIDANTGRVIFEQSVICDFNGANGTAKTYHYGTVNITTDSIGPNEFVLRDPTRGKGNTTSSERNGSLRVLKSINNNWETSGHPLEEVAFDAHYCTAKFYDFLMEHFEYSGIDGDGRSMNANVNINNGNDLVNAYWNGQSAFFGNGNCHYHPLTTLSIVGHEFAHGITSTNSKLVYARESGALNEGFSDVLGKAFQLLEEPETFEWEVGHEIVADQFVRSFRSMSNPNTFNAPKMYKGLHWRDGGGVHTNSGILNHWFYLLIEGGNGANESGEIFNINPVSIKDVLDIVFLCQTSYLQPNSTYNDMYDYSMLACSNIFGQNSPQYVSLNEAWKAVGLPYEIDISNYTDLSLGITITTSGTQYTCLRDEPLIIQATITNLGGTTIAQGTELTIEFNESNVKVTKSFFLDVDLLPGENVMKIFDDVYIINATRSYSLLASLIIIDGNTTNNNSSLFFENFSSPTPDISLAAVTILDRACFEETLSQRIRFRNVSCFDFPSQTVINYTIHNQNNVLIKAESTTLGRLVRTREVVDIIVEIPYDLANTSYIYNFESSTDTNLGNNTQTVQLVGKEDIKNTTLFTFTDKNFETNFTHTSNHPQFQYNNNFYFRSKANSNTTTSPCFVTEDNFKSTQSASPITIASACIDLIAMANPVFSFDIVQFRSSNFEGIVDLEGNSCILKLEYIGENVKFVDYIKNLERGQTYNYKYDLPPYFKGILKFTLYTSKTESNPGINTTSDIILLDNIAIDNVVSTEDQTYEQNVIVYPNPTNDLLTIDAINTSFSKIEIFNLEGRIVLSSDFSQGETNVRLSLASLNPGYYVVKILKTDDGWLRKSFVKIE